MSVFVEQNKKIFKYEHCLDNEQNSLITDRSRDGFSE